MLINGVENGAGEAREEGRMEGREERRVGRYRRRNRMNWMRMSIYFAFVVPPPVTLRWHGIRCGDVKAFAAVAVNFAY